MSADLRTEWAVEDQRELARLTEENHALKMRAPQSDDAIAAVRVLVHRVDPGASIDAIGESWMKLQFIKEQVREIEAEWKQRMIAHIQANGEVMIGSTRFYVSTPKDTKCADLPATVQWMLGMDVDTLTDCLSVNAFKPGACRKAMDAVTFGKLFKVESKAKLGIDGKPVKELQQVDEQWLK